MENLGLFVVNHWVLVTLFVVLLGMLIFTEMRRGALGYKTLTPSDAVRLMNSEKAVLLDVRDESEFRAGHILNAQHVPLALLESRLGELDADRDRPVIVYCRTGQRSAKASFILNKHGFKKVYNLGGGMLAWQSANLPLAKAK